MNLRVGVSVCDMRDASDNGPWTVTEIIEAPDGSRRWVNLVRAEIVTKQVDAAIIGPHSRYCVVERT